MQFPSRIRLSLAAFTIACLVISAAPAPPAHAAACAYLPSAVLVLNAPKAGVNMIAAANSITALLMSSNAFCSVFGATFASLSASPFTTAHTCSFATMGGDTCVIRGFDGLPVELLSFGLD